jgi:hypothetical protein
MNDHLRGDDVFFGVQKKRLLGREMPTAGEALAAIAGAEFPERRVPRRAIAGARAGTGRNQPTLDDLLEEAVRHKPLPVCAREILGLKNALLGLLPSAKDRERCGELFVGCRHGGRLQAYHAVYEYKQIVLYKHKLIVSNQCKQILLID